MACKAFLNDYKQGMVGGTPAQEAAPAVELTLVGFETDANAAADEQPALQVSVSTSGLQAGAAQAGLQQAMAAALAAAVDLADPAQARAEAALAAQKEAEKLAKKSKGKTPAPTEPPPSEEELARRAQIEHVEDEHFAAISAANTQFRARMELIRARASFWLDDLQQRFSRTFDALAHQLQVSDHKKKKKK